MASLATILNANKLSQTLATLLARFDPSYTSDLLYDELAEVPVAAFPMHGVTA